MKLLCSFCLRILAYCASMAETEVTLVSIIPTPG